MKAKKIIVVFVLVLAIFLLIPGAKSTIKPYFSGEAIIYNNQTIFGTVNTGALEIFKLADNRIYKTNIIPSDDRKYPEFFDLLFSTENGRLYIYTINGKYLYKFDISNDSNVELIKKLKDNSNDYFYGLTKTGDSIVTIGTRGVKLWNKDLEVTNSYDIHSSFAKNIKISQSGSYIFDIVKNTLKIYDGFYRDVVNEVGLNTIEDHVRNLYNDTVEGTLYVVDDSALKKIYFDGNINEFKHISNLGYDVDGLAGRDFVYFSDGVGIVKIRKSDMSASNWLFTTELGGGNGWAMGLRVVGGQYGDRVIVFNGSSILALDQDLNLIDYYAARESEYIKPEPLSLTLNTNRGWVGDEIIVRGAGFGFNEEIEIQFGKDKWSATTNQNGQFIATMQIPEIRKGIRDVRAIGQTSNLTYSTTIEVYENN